MFENSLALTYSLTYLVMGILGLFLSFSVFLIPPHNPIKNAFARYIFAVSWWGIFSFLMTNAPNEWLGTFWDKVCVLGLAFIPVGFIHFNFTFLGIAERYKRFIQINYLAAFFFLFSIFTPFFVKSTSPRVGIAYITDPGALYYLFVAYFFLISILGVTTFFLGWIKSQGNRRRQLFNLFWSSLLGYSLGGLNYNVVFGLGSAVWGVVGNLGIIFHMVVYAYTITKQRLMDISVIISRTVAELLTILFQGIIYLGLVFLYTNNVSGRIDWLFLTWTVLFGVIVGQCHQRIRLYIQTSADKIFLRGRYNYYKTLAEASSRVGEKLSLSNILSILYQTFHDVVEISNPRVFLPDNFLNPEEKSTRYIVFGQNNYFKNEGDSLDFNSPLVREMVEKRQPLYKVKELHAAIVFPLLVEERLIGFIALGPKISEDHYTDEDLRLLTVLANQAAITLDHTQSFERIKADLEVVERQLERSQRLASLGTLTAGVTHEIRNPLTVIRAETERLANQPRDQEYLKQFSELMLKHIDRISGIVQRMLGLARDKDRKEEEINLPDLVEAVSLFFNNGDKIKFVKQLENIPKIKGNVEELQEVIVNLIQNAVEAMSGSGTITLRTGLEERRPMIEVSDTGRGIPPELREKIFDPFYSTRHEGVGLGLSIVYRIVREHGGDIKVLSELGKGTTFRILF